MVDLDPASAQARKMSFLDVDGLHDEDTLVYDDDDADERDPRDGEEDMMPEGGDEDVVVLIQDAPTPGLDWANYHATDGCKCGIFEEKPCGACNKDVGRRHLCPVCHCHMHVPIEGLCEANCDLRRTAAIMLSFARSIPQVGLEGKTRHLKGDGRILRREQVTWVSPRAPTRATAGQGQCCHVLPMGASKCPNMTQYLDIFINISMNIC